MIFVIWISGLKYVHYATRGAIIGIWMRLAFIQG